MAYVMFCFAGYTCMGRHLKGEGPMFEPLVFLLIRHWGSALLITVYVYCNEKIVIPKDVKFEKKLHRMVYLGVFSYSMELWIS